VKHAFSVVDQIKSLERNTLQVARAAASNCHQPPLTRPLLARVGRSVRGVVIQCHHHLATVLIQVGQLAFFKSFGRTTE
jgi:hypothetical protein